MGKLFRVRDPVHGFVQLTSQERALADTPIFQRLRGIRQLAMANLVYPGAVHSRFDHSLGVCHIAGMLCQTLDLGDHVRLVRLAALLHDIGHGPFSHVSESALDRYADRSKLKGAQKKEEIHELITDDLIRRGVDIDKILGQQDRDHIAQLLSRGFGEPVLRSIISGPLDADKQDYLLRDSHFCGVPYGIYDIRQLHRSLVVESDAGDKVLMVAEDGVHALEQYVLAKYYLTTMVYGHRVRLITDQMIHRAIVLGVDTDGVDELRALYAYDGTAAFLRRYIGWDDARFLLTFTNRRRFSGKYVLELATRLVQRRLLKMVFAKSLADIKPAERREALVDIGKPEHDNWRRRIEAKLAQVIGKHYRQNVDPRLVVLHSYTVRSVRTESRNDEEAIQIAKRPKPQPFEQASFLFRSIREGLAEAFVEVYAPVQWEDPAQKRRLRAALADDVLEVLVTTR